MKGEHVEESDPIGILDCRIRLERAALDAKKNGKRFYARARTSLKGEGKKAREEGRGMGGVKDPSEN